MRTSLALSFLLLLARLAAADPAAEVLAHDQAFGHACMAGDVKAVMTLYDDDARLIWPGRGQEAEGRAAIEEVVRGLCKARSDVKMTLDTLDVVSLDDRHAVAVGRWTESETRAGRTTSAVIRTTEVLTKSDAGWRYLVDHASIGFPPPAATPSQRRSTR